MAYPNSDSELAEKFELVAEGYWVRGMDLADARKKAAEALVQRSEGIRAARERN